MATNLSAFNDPALAVFTLALGAVALLLTLIWPEDKLEWSILVKSYAYLAVLLNGCAVRWLGAPGQNGVSTVLFLLAAASTAWYGICAWQVYLARRMGRWRLRFRR